MARVEPSEEGDAGFGVPVWAALAIVLVLAGLWLIFGWPGLFWPALMLTPVIFAVLMHLCSGRI